MPPPLNTPLLLSSPASDCASAGHWVQVAYRVPRCLQKWSQWRNTTTSETTVSCMTLCWLLGFHRLWRYIGMQFRRGLAAPLKRYNNCEDSFKTCLKMMLQTLRSRGFGRGLRLHVSRWHRIGADFYRAMVATAPWGKLLIGRHPMRNWTRRTMSVVEDWMH